MTTGSSIKHHLTDALLMGYCAGALPDAFDLVVATHISVCDECRARMHEFDAVGGCLLEETEPTALSPASFESVLERIAAGKGSDARPSEPRPSRFAAGRFPAPLRERVGGDLDAVRWRHIGGVGQAILEADGGATVRLLRIPAGAAVPDHGHRGTELTLVLQGAFHDERDRFGPGDIEIADEEDEHRPVAEPGEDCICLAATDAPLRFRGLMPRLAQPFLRI